MKERRRRASEPVLRRFGGVGIAAIRAMTTEERQAINRGRRWRLEGLLDPQNRQVWRERMGKGSKIQVAWHERLQDPAFKAQWAQARWPDRAQPVAVACAVCGRSFEMEPHRAALSRRHACGPECLARLRRDPAFRAEIGRKLSEAKGGRVPLTCLICGRTWDAKRSVANRSP